MKIAIVGGTGAFGRALGARLASLGYDVLLGSRDRERAQRRAAVIGVAGGTNDEIVRDADLVVLAVQSAAAIDTVRELAAAIGEAPVLCVASDLRFTPGGVFPGRSEGSIAEDVAEIVAGPVVSGFHTLPAAHLEGAELLEEDALVCGDDLGSKELVLDLASKLVAGRALDAGPLANSRALEGLTAVILHLNKRYRVLAGVRVTGFRE